MQPDSIVDPAFIFILFFESLPICYDHCSLEGLGIRDHLGGLWLGARREAWGLVSKSMIVLTSLSTTSVLREIDESSPREIGYSDSTRPLPTNFDRPHKFHLSISNSLWPYEPLGRSLTFIQSRANPGAWKKGVTISRITSRHSSSKFIIQPPAEFTLLILKPEVKEKPRSRKFGGYRVQLAYYHEVWIRPILRVG